MEVDALLIICLQIGAICGRLRYLGEEEIVFSIRVNETINNRFAAGFRWGVDFILFDDLEKVQEENSGRNRIIRARIRAIGNEDRSTLQSLLSGTCYRTDQLL